MPMRLRFPKGAEGCRSEPRKRILFRACFGHGRLRVMGPPSTATASESGEVTMPSGSQEGQLLLRCGRQRLKRLEYALRSSLGAADAKHRWLCIRSGLLLPDQFLITAA